MRVPGLTAIALAACALASCAMPSLAATPAERFHAAGERARTGDYPGAIAAYDSLAAAGFESAALDWNHAQAAAARGGTGEALWALLRARERAPGDRAVTREIERLRESANLDPAELSPDPMAAVARASRQFRLDLLACLLIALSLAAHAGLKARPGARALAAATWTTLTVGLIVAAVVAAGAFARPTGVVVRRGAPMLDAASPTAEAVGTLREGEVVPVLETSGPYVRVEDSSGVRGWALAADVRPLVPGPARGA
jgi:SH3 domain-containing protein